jgi:hypothetical protein
VFAQIAHARRSRCGESDDGTAQGVTNTDSIQKAVVKEADKIYPEIYYRTEVYEREGKQCVRVDIKNNGLAPHFGGQAWVRQGSVTIKATTELYQQMIDQRQSKVRVLLQWVGKDITISWKWVREEQRLDVLYRFASEQATLLSVNTHWATFRVRLARVDESNQIHREAIDCSEPMEKLLLSWDDGNARLKVEVSG